MTGHSGGGRRAVRTVAALALSVLALAGCGSDGDSAGTTAAATDTQTRTPSSPPQDSARAVAERYSEALRDSDSEAACGALSSRVLAAMEIIPGLDSCEWVLDTFWKRVEGDERLASSFRGRDSARVRSVGVDGDVAIARYTGEIEGIEFEGTMKLVREAGRWVVDTTPRAASRAALARFRRAARAKLDREARARFDCPIDAAAASAAFGTRVEALPSPRASCRFGRPGSGVVGEDPRQPYVRITLFATRDLATAREMTTSDVGRRRVIDRPQWGEGAFLITFPRGAELTASAIVPTADAAAAAAVVIALPGAEDDRDHVADALVAAIQRG